MKEDVLGYIMRNEKSAPVSDIVSRVDGRNFGIRRAIRKLARHGLLEVVNGAAVLTSIGEKEAVRLLRAHRLWETYLQKMGTPSEELHDMAHQLEHVSDEATVDYLDDRLGHPVIDPHGSEIPQDLNLLEPGKVVRLSLLRRGNRARIYKTPGGDNRNFTTELQVGTVIEMQPRAEDGKAWSLILENGKQIKLNHKEADEVFVEMLESKK